MVLQGEKMILNIGFNELVEDVFDAITNGEAGTDTSLFVKNQTGVIAGVGSTDIALANKSLSTKSISMTYLLSISLGNGETLTEFEVNDGTIAYNRCVKAGTPKTANDEFTIIHVMDWVIVI